MESVKFEEIPFEDLNVEEVDITVRNVVTSKSHGH